jgi:hypothetical protein
MTKYILPKKVIQNVFVKNTYKALIIIYAFHLSFSAQAFTATAEAPLGGESFKVLVESSEPDSETLKQQVEELKFKLKVEKIRRYYSRYNLPLQDHSEAFIVSAERHDIDWRLVAAIGFIESTGGKYACKTADYSAFGWGSCKINFDSYEESIEIISMNLAGDNPNTAYAYAGKDIRGILQAYNPPSIVPDYAEKVMLQMEIIDNQ